VTLDVFHLGSSSTGPRDIRIASVTTIRKPSNVVDQSASAEAQARLHDLSKATVTAEVLRKRAVPRAD
jgi:hypothetical protein